MSLYIKIVLTVIAISLAVLAFGPLARPAAVRAQNAAPDLYFEPGYTMLHKPGVSVWGKVAIDRRTGDIWGFPTAAESPYPYDIARKEPPVSKPIYLGRFDFSALPDRGR